MSVGELASKQHMADAMVVMGDDVSEAMSC